ncbi:CpsD/CapB family tyrosine-protein kinase [Thalassovita sp.]|uniref:CpsD/CapB family tyrosine-protein kinase n=1 Tax=Thalassovita sp. TaxID=1979401 RepID=UPI002881AE3C|nr:CpsD/CapB family tyrosine-protein kinase [Thalassovita sp.]MDF1802038.1 CpsD/CapB family tyrosine-protein kinase [Thalassovita sp.]
MVNYVLRRNRREQIEPKPAEPDRAALLERVARHAADVEEQERHVRDALREQEEAAQTNAWDQLPTIPVDERLMDENLIITATRHDPAHATFDVLRTRLVQTLSEKGWRRVAITSPTSNCGKSFVATNLAITLSRYDNCRTVLMDMDMRAPSLAGLLGVEDAGSMGAYLRGERDLKDQFRRFGPNHLKIGNTLAIGLNDKIEPYAAELLQQANTRDRIEDMEAQLSPDIVLYDLPPALVQDDVIAFRNMFDGVLIVAGGGQTKSSEITEVMHRLGEETPLLGVILNRAEGAPHEEYGY